MIKFGIKCGLAAGAVYYTSAQGVWRSSDETSKLCNQICTTVSPYTQELTKRIPYEMPSLPQTNELSYLVKHYWNKGVIASFSFLANIPSYVGDLTDKGINSILDHSEVKNLFFSAPEVAVELK